MLGHGSKQGTTIVQCNLCKGAGKVKKQEATEWTRTHPE